MLLCFCRHDSSVKHFQIVQVVEQCGTVYVLDRQFRTLQELVKFYSLHDVPNVEAVAGVRLTHPILSVHDTSSLRDNVGERRRGRSVSAGHETNTAGENHTACHSDAPQVLQHSVSESDCDNKEPNLHGVTVSQPSSGTDNSVTEKRKKQFDRQPPIPDGDDDDSPTVRRMRENSAQSTVLCVSGSQSLAASCNEAGSDATAADDVYYSEPRNVDRQLATDLMARLLQDHGPDSKCVCGLYLADSELPRGWSMHISTECGTEGRLFFTSPTGETSWELPTFVSVDLDTEQQDLIRKLMAGGQPARQVSVSRSFSDGEKRISI